MWSAIKTKGSNTINPNESKLNQASLAVASNSNNSNSTLRLMAKPTNQRVALVTFTVILRARRIFTIFMQISIKARKSRSKVNKAPTTNNNTSQTFMGLIQHTKLEITPTAKGKLVTNTNSTRINKKRINIHKILTATRTGSPILTVGTTLNRRSRSNTFIITLRTIQMLMSSLGGLTGLTSKNRDTKFKATRREDTSAPRNTASTLPQNHQISMRRIGLTPTPKTQLGKHILQASTKRCSISRTLRRSTTPNLNMRSTGLISRLTSRWRGNQSSTTTPWRW